MEKIAFISGETIYYWSSIVLTLATLTAICFFWSLYLGKGGNGIAAFSVVPLAIALSLLLGRLVHWYCRTSSYDSFEAAMKPFSPADMPCWASSPDVYWRQLLFACCILTGICPRYWTAWPWPGAPVSPWGGLPASSIPLTGGRSLLPLSRFLGSIP